MKFVQETNERAAIYYETNGLFGHPKSLGSKMFGQEISKSIQTITLLIQQHQLYGARWEDEGSIVQGAFVGLHFDGPQEGLPWKIGYTVSSTPEDETTHRQIGADQMLELGQLPLSPHHIFGGYQRATRTIPKMPGLPTLYN